MEYSIPVIEDACKPFSNMHSVLHAIKSRFGHSSLSATVQRRKSPCMYSLNALSYWMGSSTTHIANAQGFQHGCYALLASACFHPDDVGPECFGTDFLPLPIQSHEPSPGLCMFLSGCPVWRHCL